MPRNWRRIGPPAHWALAASNGREAIVFAYADAQTGLLGAWRTNDGVTWTEFELAGDQADIPAFIGSASVDSRVDGMFAMPDGVIVIGQRRGQIVGWFASVK